MRPLRILLAEDDPSHRELLKQALTADRPAVDVRAVATGDEFINKCAANTTITSGNKRYLSFYFCFHNNSFLNQIFRIRSQRFIAWNL